MENNMDKREGGNMCCGGKDCCHGGNCGGMQSMSMCGCHGGRRHLMKMILKIVIVILIFWCGFKLGQMTGFIQAEGGYGRTSISSMMRGYGYNNSYNNGGASVPTPTQ